MILKTATNAGLDRGLGSSRLAALPRSSAQQQQRRVVVRFKENNNESLETFDLLKEELEQQLKQDGAAEAQDLRQQPLQPLFTPSEPKLSPQQLKEVRMLCCTCYT
jgi:hypothetical protein